jgi:general L-amino acid transport system substrate-binding protein
MTRRHRRLPALTGTLAGLAVAAILLAGVPARAGGMLDRVRADGAVRCGAFTRPGLADGVPPAGLLVEICRAVSAAVIGKDAPVAFTAFDPDAGPDAFRAAGQDILFLSAAEAIAHNVAGSLVPGPAVYAETTAVMVKDTAPLHVLADLAGQPLCFLQGDAAQRDLEAWFADRRLSFIRMGYQEPAEMWDAFDAGVCAGLAAETTTLAGAQRGGESREPGGRLLPEPLASFPIMAMTDVADGPWSATVGWAVAALLASDTPRADWRAGGADALPLDAPEIGLASGWRPRMVAAVGTYADIVRRTLGSQSPYRLPDALTAPWRQAADMLAPRAQ